MNSNRPTMAALAATAAIATTAEATAITITPVSGDPQAADVGTVGEQIPAGEDINPATAATLEALASTRAGDSPYASVPPADFLGMHIDGADSTTGPMNATFADVAETPDVYARKGSAANPVTEADVAADLAGTPRPVPPAIVPTVSRKVWFFPNGCTNLHSYPHCIDKATPMDATITFPWSDRMVNLQVIDHIGQVHAYNSVQLLQPGDGEPIAGHPYARWMPYQVGQARAAS